MKALRIQCRKDARPWRRSGALFAMKSRPGLGSSACGNSVKWKSSTLCILRTRGSKFADVGDEAHPLSLLAATGTKTVSDVTLRQAVDAGVNGKALLTFLRARTYSLSPAECTLTSSASAASSDGAVTLRGRLLGCRNPHIVRVGRVSDTPIAPATILEFTPTLQRSMVAKRRFPGGPRRCRWCR